jgi:hypothetical protein
MPYVLDLAADASKEIGSLDTDIQLVAETFP